MMKLFVPTKDIDTTESPDEEAGPSYRLGQTASEAVANLTDRFFSMTSAESGRLTVSTATSH
jgi:hypothetical protein